MVGYPPHGRLGGRPATDLTMPPRLLAVAPGDPFAVATFSGISTGLLGAIRDAGGLAAAVSGRPRWLARAEQAASFDRDGERWRQWYYGGLSRGGPGFREAMSAVASRRAARAARANPPDAILQLAGWYRPQAGGLLRASYHDGNLAAYLQRPDLLVDRGARRVRRALDWERRLYDRTDVIFTMSDWLRARFLDDFGQPPEKVVTVGAGTDLAPAPVAVQRDWERPRFLFVGRDWARKGGRELLAAWPAVRAAVPQATLDVVGPRTLGDHPPPGVTLVGPIDRSTPEGAARFARAYRDATAFVMPSLFEPFGIVFVEAMAHGLPCVASDRCAMPEIVADGETGRVVSAGDADGLTAALIALADPATAQAMGAAGTRRMARRFTWAAVADRVLAEIAQRLA